MSALALAGCVSSGDDGDPAGGDGNGDDSPTPGGDGTDTPDSATETPTSAPTGFENPSIETTNTGCAGEDVPNATVGFDPDAIRVTVDGALRTANPCHVASFESTKYRPADDVLQIVVAAKDDPSAEACVQCIGAVEYTATVDLEGGLPGTVVVKHGTGSDASVVATVSNDASE